MLKVAYLIGAGATHAEIINLTDYPDETYINNNGLLISQVSKRVIRAARGQRGFNKNVETVTSTEGSLNIELLITLFETNRITNSDIKVRALKKLVELDIKRRLSKTRKQKFYLYKALYELHKAIDERETLLGVISLNYDELIDEAFEKVFNEKPNYYLTGESRADIPPLLKLHGSFNWKNIRIYDGKKTIPIIPLGINKNYLIPPYNFIWGKSFEILTNCDVLRIIGCSLSQSDLGLIDLLFKAHLERDTPIEIQVIDFPNQADRIKGNYGFFQNIVRLENIEGTLIPDVITDTSNPFRIWLRAKAEKHISGDINTTSCKLPLFPDHS